MSRVEEFTRSGKKFVYIDFSNLKTNDEISQVINKAKPIISKNSPKSVYTISNFDGSRYDKETKELVATYTKANEPYVVAGAIIGMDGLKKIMASAIFSLSGRKNLTISSSKEEAIQFLLKQ